MDKKMQRDINYYINSPSVKTEIIDLIDGTALGPTGLGKSFFWLELTDRKEAVIEKKGDI